MTPTWQSPDGAIRLWLGDCLDVLPTLEAGSVDMVLTDPPYGIKEARGKNKSRTMLAVAKDYGISDWDDSPPPKEAFDEMRRVSRHQVIFGGNYFTDKLPPSSSWISWDKDNSGDFADVELAWTSHKRAARKVKWRWNGMLQENMEHKDQRVHPTQKPVGLIEWVLRNYTEIGDTVGDFYLGSGTTAVACIRLGRKCLGIEKDGRYFDIAVKRVERELARHPLFDGATT